MRWRRIDRNLALATVHVLPATTSQGERSYAIGDRTLQPNARITTFGLSGQTVRVRYSHQAPYQIMSASAQAEATALFGSVVLPGKVAQPPLLTYSPRCQVSVFFSAARLAVALALVLN